jgi:TolB protein
MVNADGSNPHLIYSGGGGPLAWSPDGSKIAFGGDGVMVMDADGSNPRSLSRNVAGYGFRPAWSPDSRTLAIVGVNGPNPLYEKDPANKDRRPDWFADAFLGHTIYLVDVATGEVRPLLADDSSGNIDPAWSPDGSQIVFASTRSGASEIWVVDADGSDLRQLTHAGQFVRFPYWRRP